jgi:crossover junction endodeoxyribonuclease RuvC
MPVLQDGAKGRTTINAGLVAETIYKLQCDRAVIEQVGVRPQEGAVGAFAFGRGFGIILGALAAAGIPVELITPQAWKKAVGLTATKDEAKDASRSLAIQKWPSQAGLFARKKDNGRSDAALIGLAAIRREK